MVLKILWNNFKKKNKLFEFLFLGTSFYFSEIMKKDLASFHSGTDFMLNAFCEILDLSGFLFHLGCKSRCVGEKEKKIWM
jgi:DNA phosphorothioation-dependent restriction protein DptG